MTIRGVLLLAGMGLGLLYMLQSSGADKHLASAAMLAGVSLLAFGSLAGSLRTAYLRMKPPGLHHNSALLARERLMRPS
jgi:hypothetical protein